MRAKTIIGGIGTLAMLIGAASDLEHSDIRVAFALIIIGAAVSYFCLKDYECGYEDD